MQEFLEKRNWKQGEVKGREGKEEDEQEQDQEGWRGKGREGKTEKNKAFELLS